MWEAGRHNNSGTATRWRRQTVKEKERNGGFIEATDGEGNGMERGGAVLGAGGAVRGNGCHGTCAEPLGLRVDRDADGLHRRGAVPGGQRLLAGVDPEAGAYVGGRVDSVLLQHRRGLAALRGALCDVAIGGEVLRVAGAGAADAGGLLERGVQLAGGGAAGEADFEHRLQDSGEGELDGGHSVWRGGNLDGALGLGGVVDSGATVDEPRGEHAAIVGFCEVASAMGVLVEVVLGVVLVRVEADGFGAARYIVPEHLPDRHREGVLGKRLGVLHEGAPVCGVSLLEPDGDIAAGDVSCAVQDTGRRRKAGGCLPAILAGVGVFDISIAGGPVCGGRSVGVAVVERTVALRGHVVENTLLFDDVVSDSFDKPEPAAGEGTV